MSNQPTPAARPTLDEFGARLALIRWAQGWNQKEASIACSLPPATWREWELTNRRPRDMVEVARKISARTGYDLMWILTGQENPHPVNPDGEGLYTARDSNPEPVGIEYPASRIHVYPLGQLSAA